MSPDPIIQALLQSIASAPGLAAAVAIVWMYSRQEQHRQQKEDQREARRLSHESDMAKRYDEATERHIRAIREMADRIETSHRDIFSRRAQGATK